MTRGPILLLAGDGVSTRAVFHALRREFDDVVVVLEDSVRKSDLVKRRVKRLGLTKVAGQVAFMALVQPVLSRRAVARIRQIREQHGLDDRPIDGPVTRVPSVNSPEARSAIERARPSVVVVNGTRIIGKETLAVIPCPAINTHAGITPLYRGVHGGYWALAEQRPDLVGTTIHLVDAGIDTGTIIAQAYFKVTPQDSFATYPYLHTAAGLPLLLKAVRDAQNGALTTQGETSLDSRLRTHPTLWEYVHRRLRKGVK